MAKNVTPCCRSEPLHEDTPLLNGSRSKGIQLFFQNHRALTEKLISPIQTPGDSDKVAMHPPNPPTPEIITISIQPDCGDGHQFDHVPAANNNVSTNTTTTTVPFSGKEMLKTCNSTPSFVNFSTVIAGDQLDVLTLNSANSVNSLLPRDELYLTQQRQEQSNGSDPEGRGGLQMCDVRHTIEESTAAIALQVTFPFLVAGLGMAGAGLLLDVVQHWEVFTKVSEIMVLVPSLLGLKGNLEMTLASRLSTQANLGTFDKSSDQLTLIAGNLALIECQAIVVGFLASWFAIAFGLVSDMSGGSFNLDHALLLCASSILTAAAASILLGVTMVGVIILSRKLNINPDNVATPIAASLGDVTSLAILAGISTLLFGIIDKIIWVGPLIIVLSLLVVPALVFASWKNCYTTEAIKSGWLPVISAMAISSIAGFILDKAVARYRNIALFQPVVNGVGGNLVAIHASRISTSLHKYSDLGQLPPWHSRVCVSPCSTFFGKDVHTTTARVLMMMVIPGHLIFAYLLCYLKTQEGSLTFSFISVYLVADVIQVSLLLYLSLLWTHWMWSRKLDPDNCSIPYLTAVGDLLGVGLLTIGFLFLELINEEDIGITDA